jgi:chemotaxis response regulator CheB
VVYGMPMVAYNIGAVIRQSALENISQIINDYLLAKK